MRNVLKLIIMLAAVLWAPTPAPAIPGTGYRPPQSTSCYRPIPGGPMVRATGNLATPDPWGGIQCSPDVTIGCISDMPDAAKYTARYGFDDRDRRGGWCAASSERAGVFQAAIRWFCVNQPWRIQSAGAAGGYDCIPTVEEIFDVLAFDDGDRLNRDYQQAIGSTPPPASTCAAPKVCILPCAVCGCPDPYLVPPLALSNCAIMIANPNISSPVLKARIKQVCGVVSAIAAYHPGVASTARNEMTLRECLGVAP